MADDEGNGQDAGRGVVSDAETEDRPVNPHRQGEPESSQQAGREEDPPQPEQQPNPEESGGQIQPYQAQEGPFAPQQQQQIQQQMPPLPPSWPPHPPPLSPGPPPQQQQPPPPPSQHAIAMAQYYEARMRDHAAAYASAAAGAAWAAAQIAAQAAEFAASTHANLGPGGEEAAGPQFPPPPPPMFDPNAMPPAHIPPPPPPGYHPYPDSNNNVLNGNYFHPHGPPDNNNIGPNNRNPWRGSNGNPWHNNKPQQRNNYNEANNYDEAYATGNNRRKRIQRRPPGGISIPRQDFRNNSDNMPVNSNSNNNSRVRRRLRDQGDSSNSSCATSITSYNSDQAMGGSGNYGPYDSSNNSGHRSSGSSNYFGYNQRASGRGGGNHYHRHKKRIKQPRDDTSLLGKTGVSALFEWCGKRRIQPSFALLAPLHKSNVSVEAGEEFEMAVHLEDGVEWGRGRGPSKGSAKQDAARKALQALVPGVVFDAGTGFLVELPASLVPPSSHHQQSHLRGHNPGIDDLAPHLAQRLAIATGRDDENNNDEKKADHSTGSSGSRQMMGRADYSSKTLKRAWNVYPGTTSTTNSEEDDENAYYASRGASVCSVLLHAMVQIDNRLTEAPQYVFEHKVPTAQMKRKGPASAYGSAIVIERGPFTCTATLKVLSLPTTTAEIHQLVYDAKAHVGGDSADKRTSNSQLAKTSEAKNADREESAETLKEKIGAFTVFTAVGVGGTKRESKHTASAKLLALLFPECKTMVEVKAAAEAAREAYAASKASKSSSNANNRRRREGRSKMPRLSLSSGISQLNATPTDNDPPLPEAFSNELLAILGVQEATKASTISSQVASFQKLNLNQDSSSETDAYVSTKLDPEGDVESDPDSKACSSGNVGQNAPCRSASRRNQLDAQVDKALAALNEHDEEGRSLPDELTVDDVGRTVLRRAEPEDIERIRRLLACQDATNKTAEYFCPVSILGAVVVSEGDVTEENDERCSGGPDQDALRLWGSSTIVLLLCRAIAAFEDPPLGCAVLTLGFSMQKGPLLRIAQIGSEQHLPQERFLECLEAFATCMQCTLERGLVPKKNGQQKRSGGVRLSKEDLRAVIESHLPQHSRSPSAKRACDRSHNANVSAPLQSVQEESEGGDDSDRPKESSGKAKGQDKPCKRSRVE